MRLEKLSCIEVETGEVMVADVGGYVSGEDGKLGLRGTVVDRAGDHVRAAMIGAFYPLLGTSWQLHPIRSLLPHKQGWLKFHR